MELAVILPAAGRSTRFGERDKLSIDIEGRALLLRTVEAFARRDEVRTILIAGPVEGTPEGDAFRTRFGPTLAFHGARIVDGRKTARWESVRNALAEVPDDATHVAVHDAARPNVGATFLSRMIDAATVCDAVAPALPIDDTVKRTEGDAVTLRPGDDDDALAGAILGDAGAVAIEAWAVKETVNREHLWRLQTPQIFRTELLRRAFAEVDPDGVTDDAGLVERLGEPVHLVMGDPANIKVTRESDVAMIATLMAAGADTRGGF